MKISKFFLCALIAVGAFNGLYAARTNQAKPKAQRIHLQDASPSQAKDGVLLVQTADGSVALKSLRCDKKGAYFTKKDLIETTGAEAKGWPWPHSDNDEVDDGARVCRYCRRRFYNNWDYYDHLETVHGK